LVINSVYSLCEVSEGPYILNQVGLKLSEFLKRLNGTLVTPIKVFEIID